MQFFGACIGLAVGLVLGKAVGQQLAHVEPSENAEMDEDTRQALEALGYVE